MNQTTIIYIPGASGADLNKRFPSLTTSLRTRFNLIELNAWDSKDKLKQLTFKEISQKLDQTISDLESEKIILLAKSIGASFTLKYNHPKVIGKILWAPALKITEHSNFDENKRIEKYDHLTEMTIKEFDTKTKTYIIHGTNDPVINIQNSEQILAKAKGKLYPLEGADHSYKTPEQNKEITEKTDILADLLEAESFIGKEVKVEMDRPLGTKHPKCEIVYEVNYGFIPNTISGDGEELDAYLLGIDKPVTEFEGECIALIHRSNDNDNKLIVVPKGMKVSKEDIIKQTHFQEKWFKSKIIN